MHDQAIRDKVRKAYVHDRLDLKAASKLADVGYPTGLRWKKSAAENGDDWDKARAASRIAAGGVGDMTTQVLEDFAIMFQATIKRLKDTENINPLDAASAIAQLSDSYTKVMKAAGGSDRKLNKLAVAMEVLKLLSEFTRENYPENVESFLVMLEPFGNYLSAELK